MSRVGKKPVPIVSGVTANVEGQTVKMKGPKGALQFVVHDDVSVELKYFEGTPVIKEIERVSKPGRRVYASVKNLPRINNGLGVAILSTPKGVMADHEARDANVGGEVLFTVF